MTKTRQLELVFTAACWADREIIREILGFDCEPPARLVAASYRGDPGGTGPAARPGNRLDSRSRGRHFLSPQPVASDRWFCLEPIL